MTPKINIITPYDLIHNDARSILLISLSKQNNEQLQNFIIENANINLNIYLAEIKTYNKVDIDWLLNAFSLCDVAIVDLDNMTPSIKKLAAYFISKSKTYWLTNGDGEVYNHLSVNRVYNFEFLTDYIGD